MPNVTTSVSVTFTLSSATTSGPPYNIPTCSGSYTTQLPGNDPVQNPFTGFGKLNIGTPQPSGASFSVSITDLSYGTNWASSIGNWALVFIPRPGTTQLSPFGPNAASALITGNGGSLGSQPGSQTFTLPIPTSAAIQTLGNNVTSAGWDWMLMVQMNVASTPASTRCFSSDPEMDVTS
jgi:hypothetical protein